jgi:hypothetical protein
MTRLAGRNSRLYAAIASGASAEPIATVKTFNLDATSERFDATAFGDTTKTYVAGLPDSTATISGIFDDESQQFWTSAADGVARKWYFYANHSDTSKYFFGTAFFDMSVESDVNGVIGFNGTMSAATSTVRVG